MNVADMIFAARRAQQLTGKLDAAVAFIVSGEWRGPNRLTRLAGNSGPFGRSVKQCPHGVLCRFTASRVLAYAVKMVERKAVTRPGKRRAWK